MKIEFIWFEIHLMQKVVRLCRGVKAIFIYQAHSMHHCNYISTQLLCIMVYSTVTLLISIYITCTIYLLICFYIESISTCWTRGSVVDRCYAAMVSRSASCWWLKGSLSILSSSRASWTTPLVTLSFPITFHILYWMIYNDTACMIISHTDKDG